MGTNYHAVLFDLDGTLLDTLQDLADSCNETLRSLGYPEHTVDEIRMFVGNGLGVLMERALPGGRQNPDYDRALRTVRECYAHNWQNKTKPYDGILTLISTLGRLGIKTGIISNKPDAQVKELARLYFKGYIDDTTAIGEKESQGIRRKPYPDSVLTVMDILGVTKENTIYVGDSDVDIQTAKNAGIPCISVCWGFRSRQFLLDHGAQTLISSPQELIPLLQVQEGSWKQ